MDLQYHMSSLVLSIVQITAIFLIESDAIALKYLDTFAKNNYKLKQVEDGLIRLRVNGK